MMEISKFIILGVLFNFNVCDGLNILAVFPLPIKSHGILGDSIVKLLIDAGHKVTYISPIVKDELLHPKLQIIDVPENRNMFSENSLNIKMIMDKKINFQNTDFVTSLMINVSSQTIQNPKIQKLIQDPDIKFDVVIGQWMFSDLYCVFAAIFDCPMIWLSTMQPHYIILNMVDGPTNPAYTNAYQNVHVHPLSFKHRIYELWTQIDGLIRKSFKFYYKEEKAYQRLIVPILKQKNRRIPSYEEIRLNASLVLGNTQVVMGEAIALPQSYKHIGGYHIDEQLQPLPENLKNLLDNAGHGVIYFSMGSNIKSKDLPVELKQGILKVFGSLNQTVIWKFEETLSGLPKNVHIVQWAPQQSILAHPNLVLFITHGGLLSLTEAVHFGVPVIVIPAFADQFANALRAEKKGYGKKIELTYTMYKDLKIGIDEVVNNPKYSKKAKEISAAYHDRPISSKQELLFWVSHVVRTRGAPHLRSPALQLPLYQLLYLDLIALIIVSAFVLIAIVKRVVCMFGVKILFRKEKRS